MQPAVLPDAAKAIVDAGTVTDNCTVNIDAVGGAITGSCTKTQIWTVTARIFAAIQPFAM